MQRNIFPDDWMHFPRKPSEYMLFMINEGVLYIQENEVRYELHHGDMLLLEPGHFHIGYKKAFVDFYFIHMPPDTLTPSMIDSQEGLTAQLHRKKHQYYRGNPFDYDLYDSCKSLIPKTMKVPETAFKHIRGLMEEAMQALAAGDEDYKLICSRNMLDILIRLAKSFALSVLSEAPASSELSRKGKQVEEILSLLHERYSYKWTGDEIESRLHSNFDYLNRIFKEQTGLTIFEYLTIFRINRAKEFLTNGSLRIHEIAALTGFANEYHFNRVFARLTGIPPGKYRKANP
ncbi:helix-turn-helix transcriptional regulator [Paenibacillus sinensis]|nr:AraC family transcriptional regulator [Paenibacillus sinensis]